MMMLLLLMLLLLLTLLAPQDMEQQQFYKMVPYEASARVPLVISGKGIVQGQTFLQATSLIDLYPTLLEYGKASVPAGHDIDGHSLVPLLSGKASAHDKDRPQYAVSQGHMADNAISWFVIREGDWKIIVYVLSSLSSSMLSSLLSCLLSSC